MHVAAAEATAIIAMGSDSIRGIRATDCSTWCLTLSELRHIERLPRPRPHVQRICQLVLERAGRLGAAAVAAAIEQTEALKGEGEVLVGAEGSLIRYNERFR